MDDVELRIEALAPGRWDDFVDLFSRPGPRGGGGPGTGSGCWCMWWRDRGGPDENRAAMERLVAGGARPGLLAYEDETAVGWISVAPRDQYIQLQRSRTYAAQDDDEGVWAIVCVYVHPSSRRTGVAGALLGGAIELAQTSGAQAIEAYPAADASRSDYMGRGDALARRGFIQRETRGKRIAMRLAL
jgi:GNAT superfamily N-acetyltransferase